MDICIIGLSEIIDAVVHPVDLGWKHLYHLERKVLLLFEMVLKWGCFPHIVYELLEVPICV